MAKFDFFLKLKEAAAKAASIILLPHVSADGDAIGSSLALQYVLKDFCNDTRVVLNEPIPDKYMFLDRECITEIYDPMGDYKADMYIALDTGDIRRLADRQVFFRGSNTWNIDHHKTNDGYAEHNLVDTSASSTGEIIYDFYKFIGKGFGPEEAEAIFTAVSTDTGGLRYSNTTPKSLRVSAELLETGIDISEITHRVFDMTPYQKLLLKAVAIENMRLHFSGKLALITLKKEDFSFLMGKDEYFDGIVNIAINTEGVEAGILMRENGNGDIKVNMRSSADNIDVAVFANENGGGGHVRAAGFTAAGREFSEVYNSIIEYFGALFEENDG